MSLRKTLLSAFLVASSAWLVGCELYNDDDVTEETSTAQPPEMVERETNAPREHEELTTGSAGTTSGITGSDMNESDETTGSGQSQGDDLFQTVPAGSTDAPDHETSTPEQQSSDTSDNPAGGNAGGQGKTQGSTNHSPDENQGQ
ncbi:hypothetical protein [Litchfieldella xinjiangensis]|uniref:hypothetical protein n=1 Tax=Litchfieldella xinjiangensis TaxID=1166948 RepID=UPI000694F4CD|nr:hypothetical protein [Halomonas xinjiangensis]